MKYIIKTTNNRNCRTMSAPLPDGQHATLPSFYDEYASEQEASRALAEAVDRWVYNECENLPEITAIDIDADGGMDLYTKRLDEAYKAAVEEIRNRGSWEYDGVCYRVIAEEDAE